MQLFTDILRFATISQLLLLGFLLLKKGRSWQYFLPTTLFCLSVTGYLLVDWEQLPDELFLIFLGPAFALPYGFWLFSKSLFDDNFRFERWVWWMLLVLLTLLFINYAFRLRLSPESALAKLLQLLHHAQSLLFIILGIVEAARNRSADLLQTRLQFRPVFIVLTAMLMTATVLSETAFPDDTPPVLEFLQKLVIAGLTFFFTAKHLEFKSGFFNEMEPEEPVQPKPEVDERLVVQLLQLVEAEKFYRTEGLTIRRLAEKMEVKEYKLRQAINGRLGFRNFNDFLNSYRIGEACVLLTDPNERDLTVLEIAYRTGYNSLAPFNKAFREITGMTPTEYRQRNRQ